MKYPAVLLCENCGIIILPNSFILLNPPKNADKSVQAFHDLNYSTSVSACQ